MITDDNRKIPVCVDLDGTLITDDVLQIRLRRIIRERPWLLLPAALKFLQGRAYLKRWITALIPLDPGTLKYNRKLLDDLQELQRQGHDLYLATAADGADAQAIARHLGIFQGCFASNGRLNLRACAKGKCLAAHFGQGGFAYAGNSADDLKVWDYAGKVIAVNVAESVMNRVRERFADKLWRVYD